MGSVLPEVNSTVLRSPSLAESGLDYSTRVIYDKISGIDLSTQKCPVSSFNTMV